MIQPERDKAFYKCVFDGRQKGALGICHRITEVVLAGSPAEAVLALYSKYECVCIDRMQRRESEDQPWENVNRKEIYDYM